MKRSSPQNVAVLARTCAPCAAHRLSCHLDLFCTCSPSPRSTSQAKAGLDVLLGNSRPKRLTRQAKCFRAASFTTFTALSANPLLCESYKALSSVLTVTPANFNAVAVDSATSDATLATPSLCALLMVQQAFSQAHSPRRLQAPLDHCCFSFLHLAQAARLPLDPATIPPGILRLQCMATRCEA